jgi:hypothetical protein
MESHPAQSIHESGDFLRIVDDLELAAGRTFNGEGRRKCAEAFRLCPRGVAHVAARAIAEANRNPIGLLIWLIDHGEHEKADRTIEREEEVPFGD